MSIRYRLPLAAIAILLLLALAGCGAKSKLCCNQIGDEFDTSHRSYCIDHTIAARLYIQGPADKDEQRERLARFGNFAVMLEICQDVPCINQAVDTSTVVPGFKEIYNEEHEKAEEQLVVDEAEKTDLIKCGFRHAIDAGIQ